MPLFNLQDPDAVGSSEYRAIYDCLQDGLDSHDPQENELTREEYAASMLEEFIAHAFIMLASLGKKPQLKVEYFGGVEPNLEWPDSMNGLFDMDGLFDIVHIDAEAEDLHVLTYKDVSIYHAVKDDDMTSDCWFATYPNCNWESDDAFDVRDLDEPPEEFDPNLLLETEDIKALAWAIEQGKLTQDGLNE